MFILFFTFALFASGILVNKLLLAMLPPTLFVGIRMLSAGTILLLLTWKKYRSNFSHAKEDWFLLIGIAIFTTFIPSVLKAYALSRLTTAHATLLGSIDPFITALYSYILFREKLSLNKIIGILVGCSGVILSINFSLLGPKACGLSILLPQLAALGAVGFSRWGWIMVQMQLRKNRYAPAQLNGIVMLQSGIIALLAASWLDPITSITISSWPYFWLLLIYTVIVGNVIAYTLYASLLKLHNATFVSLAGFSIPIFAGIYAWIFFNEKLTLHFLLAASVIFIGLLIFYYDDIKSKKMRPT